MSDEQFEFFFRLMPEERQKKAMRYVRAEDRKLCVAAFALLSHALRLNDYEIGEYQFAEDENGKPYLKNLPLKFNLSHTSDAVACAVSSGEIGVDIQKKVDRYEAVMQRVCCENERNLIMLSQNPVDVFADIWTLKESYAKCVGTGLSKVSGEYDFSSVAAKGAGELYGHHFLTVEEADYTLSVCSAQPIKEATRVSILSVLG